MSAADQPVVMFCPVCGAVLIQGACAKGHPQPPPPDYDPSTWKRGARFSHEGLDPDAGTYIKVEDRLRIVSTCSLATQLDVGVRILKPNGQIVPILRSFSNLPATRTPVTFEMDLTEGFLLSLNISTPTASVRYGLSYVDAALIRGTGANAISLRSIADAYIITGQGFGWPDDLDYPSVLGPGFIRSIGATVPGAGADWTIAVPVGARWEVICLNAVLTTSAAVAARAPVIQLKDNGGATVYKAAFTGTQAASTAQNYSAAEAGQVFTA